MVSVSAEPPEVTWTHQRSCDVAIVPVDWEQGQEQATYLSRSSSVLSLRDDSAFQDKEREKKKKEKCGLQVSVYITFYAILCTRNNIKNIIEILKNFIKTKEGAYFPEDWKKETGFLRNIYSRI